MKRYIKPNTEMHNVEMQSMIAATTLQLFGTTASKDGSGDYEDAKQTDISSPSVWDEEE